MTAFDALPLDRVEADLLDCCAVPRWAAQVAAGRPYRRKDALLAAADAAARTLTWPEVRHAVAAHPRIGQRVDGTGRSAAWSRREQAGVADADAATAAALAAANRRYEERFGHVFLVCAAGRTDTELLAAASQRLGNDESTERGVVTDELRKIALLRLGRLVDGLG